MTLAEVAGAAYVPENLPEGMEPGLDEQTFYDPENFVFPFGAHACVVDVDAETGKVKVVRYVAVDDCGPAINPMLIDGQVHGGITHAIGQALYERIALRRVGPAGDRARSSTTRCRPRQSCPASRPTAPRRRRRSTRSASRASARPARSPRPRPSLNAVIDALRPLGVTFIDMPLSPMRVWEAIQEAKGKAGAPA